MDKFIEVISLAVAGVACVLMAVGTIVYLSVIACIPVGVFYLAYLLIQKI